MTKNDQGISIIILNWNGYGDTVELLESLNENVSDVINIYVIDNHSSSDDVKKLNLRFGEKITIIKCEQNYGFSGGNNIGIKSAIANDSYFILLLNNDTIVEKDFLKILINKFKDDKNIGIVAPQINYYDNRSVIWSAGGSISKVRASGFALSGFNENKLNKNDRIVEFASGCCLLIKSEVFKKIGLFDENYFLYVEDTDLCYRTTKAGYKLLVTSDTKIYHKVSQATKKSSEILPLYYTTRNRLYFAKKNFGYFFYISFAYIYFTMKIKTLGWLSKSDKPKINAVKLAFEDFLNSNFGYRDLTI
jgi:GT2 family glycosyltransferase